MLLSRIYFYCFHIAAFFVIYYFFIVNNKYFYAFYCYFFMMDHFFVFHFLFIHLAFFLLSLREPRLNRKSQKPTGRWVGGSPPFKSLTDFLSFTMCAVVSSCESTATEPLTAHQRDPQPGNPTTAWFLPRCSGVLQRRHPP